ncbi:hypothetical protein Hanom_Chr05g00410991 [Helianthus anomalus]
MNKEEKNKTQKIIIFKLVSLSHTCTCVLGVQMNKMKIVVSLPNKLAFSL